MERRKKKKKPQARYRTTRSQQEVPVNFMKIKAFICLIFFASFVVMHQMDIKIGEFTSEKIYDMLYYDEDITTFNERYLNFDSGAIKAFWNQQK